MVAAPSSSPLPKFRRSRAIQYAEDVLGVNSVYDTASALAYSLSLLLDDKADTSKSIRAARLDIELREQEISSRVQKDLDGTSQAAIDREIKNRLFKDESWVDSRKEVVEHQDRLDDLETSIRGLELKLRVETARIWELGGYLEYLASGKNATAVSMQISGSPWS